MSKKIMSSQFRVLFVIGVVLLQVSILLLSPSVLLFETEAWAGGQGAPSGEKCNVYHPEVVDECVCTSGGPVLNAWCDWETFVDYQHYSCGQSVEDWSCQSVYNSKCGYVVGCVPNYDMSLISGCAAEAEVCGYVCITGPPHVRWTLG